jgi:4-amino-4-deoxy-L-arabinose transferase-like glycosyltransferase
MFNLKNLVYRNIDLIFIGLFFVVTLFLLWVPPRWDEGVYMDFFYFPLNPTGQWVPHPPLIWYLLVAFSLIPRMAILTCSLASMFFLFYACRRLYGGKIAGLAVAILASNWLYMLLGSLVMFTDGPVTAFMTVSTMSFLCWLKLGEQKFLLISGLGLALASLTKYTAAPIVLVTSFVWLLVVERRLRWAEILKVFGVAVVSLLPLAVWSFMLYQAHGNFVNYYYTLYDFLPSTGLLTIFSPLNFAPFYLFSCLPIFAYNIGYYAVMTFLLANFSLISWARQHEFDFDSKLLLIHITVIFLLFVIINKQDIGNFRYVLPMAPSLAIISAKNMIKEKEWLRFSIILVQFLCASIIAYVALVMYLFR